MSTITKDVFIPKNHKLNLEVDIPPDIPAGEAIITLTVKAKGKTTSHVNRMAELDGKYKGQIWMSEDFDAPLEDFAEYM